MDAVSVCWRKEYMRTREGYYVWCLLSPCERSRRTLCECLCVLCLLGARLSWGAVCLRAQQKRASRNWPTAWSQICLTHKHIVVTHIHTQATVSHTHSRWQQTATLAQYHPLPYFDNLLHTQTHTHTQSWPEVRQTSLVMQSLLTSSRLIGLKFT